MKKFVNIYWKDHSIARQLENGGLMYHVMIQKTFLKMVAGYGQLTNPILPSHLGDGNVYYTSGVKAVASLLMCTSLPY
ncbi:hypothetical protein LINPERPRIM_LOCUS38807 [Linum perenne]